MTTGHGTTAGRRVGRALVCLAVALTMLVAVTSPASAATKRSLTLKLAPATVTTGAKVTASGKLSKSPKGTTVRIERLAGRQWKSFKTARTTSAKGAFKVTFTATGTGTTSYRAVAKKTKKLKAITSRSRKLTVRAVTPAPAPPAPAPPAPPAPDPYVPDPTGVGSTALVSRAADGQGTDGFSSLPALSADGRFVAYYSDASNLVPGDTNEDSDVFLWDRQTATTVKVSTAPDGSAADSGSYGFRQPPAISADGRYVAFSSYASNLVAGDTNGTGDVFVWDRVTATTVMVTPTDVQYDGVSSGLGEDPSISADGRYVTYEGYRQGADRRMWQVFVWDRQTSTTVRVSQTPDGTAANDDAERSSISADGRFIAYNSSATNLTAGETDTELDVFVWDRQTSTTAKVSRAAGGGATNGSSSDATISSDGRYVTYGSTASNIVGADTNDLDDVFLWDRLTGTTTKISNAADGTATNAASYTPVISSAGRHVTYYSYASNIVPGDSNGYVVDVFVWNRQTGETVNVTQGHAGGDGETGARLPSISSDGRYIAFESDEPSHVPGDTNGRRDIFVWDRLGTP